MNSLITITRKEFLEIIRSKKMLILVILFAFVAISSPILAKLIPTLLKSMPATPGLTFNIPEPTWQDAIDQLIKNLSQIGMLVVIFLFAGAIAEEKTKKTLELTLTKPFSRAQFVLAKFIASAASVKLVYIGSMIVFFLYTRSLFGAFSFLHFLWLSLFLLIYILLILAITLLMSAVANNQIIAVGFAFLTQIVLAIVFGYFKAIAIYSPSYITGYYKDLMARGNYHDFLPAAYASLIAIILSVLISIFFFRRQEIER
jgi:ABC-2 type transport system permease protein